MAVFSGDVFAQSSNEAGLEYVGTAEPQAESWPHSNSIGRLATLADVRSEKALLVAVVSQEVDISHQLGQDSLVVKYTVSPETISSVTVSEHQAVACATCVLASARQARRVAEMAVRRNAVVFEVLYGGI